MTKLSENQPFDIDSSLTEIKQLCTDVPIAIIFKNIIELTISIYKIIYIKKSQKSQLYNYSFHYNCLTSINSRIFLLY